LTHYYRCFWRRFEYGVQALGYQKVCWFYKERTGFKAQEPWSEEIWWGGIVFTLLSTNYCHAGRGSEN